MLITESDTFFLEDFEGPLDLLWHLIHREEIDIYAVSIVSIIEQFIKKMKQAETLAKKMERSAEFIALAAALLWFKSKTLLPSHERVEQELLEEEDDPKFEIIHRLIDYCRFKQAGKELADLEQQQNAYYTRGVEAPEFKKQLGIDHLSLEDLAALFHEILAKAAPRHQTVADEEWKVSDKIEYLRQLLKGRHSIPFTEVFDPSLERMELIVTFLALLEMMKSEEVVVNKSYHILWKTKH